MGCKVVQWCPAYKKQKECIHTWVLFKRDRQA
jgi:hypothetical protein